MLDLVHSLGRDASTPKAIREGPSGDEANRFSQECAATRGRTRWVRPLFAAWGDDGATSGGPGNSVRRIVKEPIV
jgi:hypothetical protein